MPVTIRDIRVINTAPARINLTVVKVETSEPGLYGVGDATFAYRDKAVTCYVEEYLKPLLVGRDVSRIEDLQLLMTMNAYWHNGPVTGNAVSGVDMALWDIKGKMAGMPIYDLMGGKCREAARTYRHAGGKTPEEILEKVQKFAEDGAEVVRVQQGGYGGHQLTEKSALQSQPGVYIDGEKYIRDTITMIGYVRKHLDPKVGLCHDVHERIPPIDAVNLARRLEEYDLYFLEDLLPPEQGDWFRNIRGRCSTPLAMGELYNNPKEWDFLIKDRLIDFIRVHISQIGGITPARKLAVFCEQFGVRTAWHGPGDLSPVGHAANIQLDLCCQSFGIQEWSGINDVLAEVFPGSPEYRKGYVFLNDKPGISVDIDEEKAKLYPPSHKVTDWTQTRNPDGSMLRP